MEADKRGGWSVTSAMSRTPEQRLAIKLRWIKRWARRRGIVGPKPITDRQRHVFGLYVLRQGPQVEY